MKTSCATWLWTSPEELKSNWKEEMVGEEMYVQRTAAEERCVLGEQYEYLATEDTQRERYLIVAKKTTGRYYGSIFFFYSPEKAYARIQGSANILFLSSNPPRYSITVETNVFSDVNNSKSAADFELALSYDMMM